MDEPQLLDVLRRCYVARISADCLDEGTVAALADASLPAADAATATAHLGQCLSCLAAYAAVRRLLDDGEQERTRRPQRLLAARVPLGWTVATAAAAAGLAWLVATTGIQAVPEGPSTVEMSGLRTTETISGTVRALERAGTTEVAAHVLEIVVDGGGRRYTVFVWGEPTLRVGQRVSIEGHFLHDGGGHRGVATRITADAR